MKQKKSPFHSPSEAQQGLLEQVRVVLVTLPDERRRFQRLLKEHHYLGGLKPVGEQVYYAAVDAQDRTIADVLREIAVGYARGPPNGIQMGAESALVWRARRCVEAAARYLVIPDAIRSLAPLPVNPPLAIHTPDGRLLNDPPNPYWGSYQGDEDTRRKPAYHNGTAWTWPFPGFCEALAIAWDNSPRAVAAAKAYLGSMDLLLNTGCIGQIPEILDGDAPHLQRGCDAQAWGATEALRVWKLLNQR